MPISFVTIQNTLVPSVSVEFDSSRAQQGPSILSYRALLIGQKTAAGSAEGNTAVRCTSPDRAAELAGLGSMLYRQALAWFASNRSTELWLGVLDDDEYGDAAQGLVAITGTATAKGLIAFYFGGVRIAIGVNIGDDADDIGEAVEAAIGAAVRLPITAVNAGGSVAVEFRNAGEVGNGYDIRHSFLDGEALPAGIAVAITPMAGGTGNPPLEGLFAAIEPQWFHILPHPYLDATNLTAIEAELADRNDPTRSMDGQAITAASGSFGALTALAHGRNSPHSEIWVQTGSNPLTPSFEFAAEAGALVALYGAADPALPFQTLAMSHTVATAEGDQWSPEERNMLLREGLSTTKRAAGGVVQLERAVTTYKTNPSGADDTAYRDVTTLLTLMYLRYDFRANWQRRFPRHKLADDGTRISAGQKVVTPKVGKAEAVLWFGRMEKLGMVEGAAQFKRDLVVERNDLDRNRLDFLLPPDLMNQLIVTAAQIQFRQ